jgi:hypothetical protein
LSSGVGQNVVESGVSLCGSKSYDTLMCRSVRRAVEGLSRLEAHGHGSFARQVNDLLETRATGATRDQHPVERASGTQRFAHGMNACQQAALRA